MLLPTPPPIGPARVLVVDDLIENRQTLTRLLKTLGHISGSAEDGDQALRTLKEADPGYDLVLLDIEMPRTDGIEVLRGIKNDPGIASTRVVMVSGVDDVDAVARCIELGADDFISKPWDSRIIVARIRSSLEKIKTIGDAYMVAGSLPERRADHLSAMADFALDLVVAVPEAHNLDLRIGIHCGPAVAGVLGTMKLSYDVWGDTINVASRMESNGEPRRIHVSGAVRERLEDTHAFESRGTMSIKGVGPMTTYFLVGRR